MSKPTHRIPTKQTPFSSTNNGGAAAAVGRHQRATLTTSIRKAKRGQTVARKRHMQLVGNIINNNNNTNSAGDDDGIQGKTTDNNPYSRNGQHIKDAIHYAQIIVQLCSSSPSNNTTTMNQASVIMQQLATSLDRLCELLTPDEADINPSSQQQIMNLSLGLNSDHAATNHNFMYHPPRDTAASYDSSMAGMTANAILSQFITNASSGQDTNLAVALAESLGSIILSSQQSSTHYNNNNIVGNSSNDTTNNSSLAIKAVIVLNQLAATDPPPPNQQQHTIFEESSNVVLDNTTALPKHIPTSWCHVIVNSSALSSILQQLFPRICVGTTTANNNNNNNNSNNNNTTLVVVNNIAICEKCVFVIGNLLGDSFMARQALLELGALSTLIACVGMGLEKVKLLLGQQQQQQGQQQQLEVDSLVIVLQLLRNCIWSLINFIRGGDTTTISIMTEIHRVDLAVLLSLPESIQSIIVITNNAEECIRASFDVAIETCWLIVYLTNHREAMMFGIENWLSQDILVGLGSRLCSGVDAAIIQFKQIDDDGDDDDDNLDGDQSTSLLTSNPRLVDNVTNSSIPCCRALTNIAIYLDSIPPNGEAISQAKQSVTSALLSEMTARCLAELISLGSIGVGTTASAIACSAASLASICLTDASRDYENYTGAAVWSLLPALVRGLVGPMCTYEFRREVVWSIWNTLQHNRIQHRLLMEIIGTSATEVAEALTGNLTSLISSDEVEPSLGIVDLLLRTVDDNHMRSTIGKSLKIVFEEVGLVDALWYVCDNDVDESDVAEKAAELIDDFYEEQEEEDEDDRMMPSVNGHQFQFQAPSHTGQFNFG